ncbi:hypothetical protein VSDG_09502 [Cytospora chrysosperma]|uniref:Uncharacterized protein n=1 Tax=Cytospora chrysosperma TaxID=252740 RepID=A0A423VCK9_CYTCH|nr:hypothetical protein VSDG_09502 [Valsa sordida]
MSECCPSTRLTGGFGTLECNNTLHQAAPSVNEEIPYCRHTDDSDDDDEPPLPLPPQFSPAVAEYIRNTT